MKDAKGHGSEARGIDHPVYNTAQKLRGYNGKQTPLSADYANSGAMLRSRLGEMSSDEHKAAGDEHVRQANSMKAEHASLVNSEMAKLGGAHPGPLISGIVSDKFSSGAKDRLRDLAVGAGKHTGAAFAHYAASRMHLPTARDRYQSLKKGN